MAGIPTGRNWVCLYNQHLAGIGFVLHGSPRRELALFRTFHLPAAAPLVMVRLCPHTPTLPGLALFGTIGIGLEWWNDGILE
jgi:hypothetical protein